MNESTQERVANLPGAQEAGDYGSRNPIVGRNLGGNIRGLSLRRRCGSGGGGEASRAPPGLGEVEGNEPRAKRGWIAQSLEVEHVGSPQDPGEWGGTPPTREEAEDGRGQVRRYGSHGCLFFGVFEVLDFLAF